jgi:hypothetical protein
VNNGLAAPQPQGDQPPQDDQPLAQEDHIDALPRDGRAALGTPLLPPYSPPLDWNLDDFADYTDTLPPESPPPQGDQPLAQEDYIGALPRDWRAGAGLE